MGGKEENSYIEAFVEPFPTDEENTIPSLSRIRSTHLFLSTRLLVSMEGYPWRKKNKARGKKPIFYFRHHQTTKNTLPCPALPHHPHPPHRHLPHAFAFPLS